MIPRNYDQPVNSVRQFFGENIQAETEEFSIHIFVSSSVAIQLLSHKIVLFLQWMHSILHTQRLFRFYVYHLCLRRHSHSHTHFSHNNQEFKTSILCHVAMRTEVWKCLFHYEFGLLCFLQRPKLCDRNKFFGPSFRRLNLLLVMCRIWIWTAEPVLSKSKFIIQILYR